MRLRTLSAALIAAGLIVACSNSNGLASPSDENVIDTVTLGALHSTAVGIPSAYLMSPDLGRGPVWTDRSSNYDFAYDLDSLNRPVLLPGEATGVYYPSVNNPGLQVVTTPFDSIIRARSNGYVVDKGFVIDSGEVLMARSLIRCSIGVPVYAKLEVLGIDSVAHTVKFRILVDINCGYRGLEPGLPPD